MFDDSLRSVYEDPDFTQPIQLLRGGATDSDNDGQADYQFDDPVTMDVLITQPEASPFEIGVTGPDDHIMHTMCADLDRNITEEDRVIFDDGLGERAYRVAEPRPTKFDGDSFAWYKLYEDNRGETDSGGSSGDDDLVR